MSLKTRMSPIVRAELRHMLLMVIVCGVAWPLAVPFPFPFAAVFLASRREYEWSVR